MIKYRELEKSEVANVLFVLDNAYGTPLSSQIDKYDEYVDKLSKLACNYGAFDENNKPVGFIAFYKNDYNSKAAYVSQVVVDNTIRGQGIGYNLMENCKNVSKLDGFEYIKLEVGKNNLVAQKFYARYGFVLDKENDNSLYLVYKIV